MLIQQKFKTDSDNNTDHNKLEAMRDLGTHSCKQLQGMKVSDVELLASSKIDTKHLATFYKSFKLQNYEWTQKGDVEDDKEDDKDEDVDLRTKRKVKTLDSFSIEHE